MVFDLSVGGQIVSHNEVFFDRMRNLELPLKPAIQSTIVSNGSTYTITLRSPVLARNVYLSFGDLEVRLSDNYFDLLPSEDVAIRANSSATLDQLKAALKIVSLTDAFFDQRPTYREHLSIMQNKSSQ